MENYNELFDMKLLIKFLLVISIIMIGFNIFQINWDTPNWNENIIALIGIRKDKKTKKLIDLDQNSNVLVIGCEGNTDVKLYKQLLSKGRK